MNSVKNKTTAENRENKTSGYRIAVQSEKTTTKKRTGSIRNKVNHASTPEFFSLKDISGYNKENLATLLGTTTRTIQNKKNSGEPFDIAQTERLRKLNQLFKEGNELFGNKEEFNEWLQKPSYGLDYKIPSELLKQPGGLDKIMAELNSIRFGDAI